MFLFLHDIGATPSLWIPTIRALLGDKANNYNDNWLKENFTLALPGHTNQDRFFDMADVYKDILNFQKTKHEAQQEVANQLLLNNTRSFITSLKSKKLVLIGHSFGSLVALNFSTKHREDVEKIVIIALGSRFSKFGLFLKQMEFNRLNSKKRHELQLEIETAENLRHRVLVSHFLDNPNRRSYQSGLRIMKKYNFKKLFKQLSIKEQIDLATLPILAIGGKLDRLTKYTSIQELEHILETQAPKEYVIEEQVQKTSQTIIISQESAKTQQKKELKKEIKLDFKIILYNQSSHSPMDKYYQEVAGDIKKFLENEENLNLNQNINLNSIDKRKDIVF
jgi:pimeloyl-ACP methyl ester carboxylesterase